MVDIKLYVTYFVPVPCQHSNVQHVLTKPRKRKKSSISIAAIKVCFEPMPKLTNLLKTSVLKSKIRMSRFGIHFKYTVKKYHRERNLL